MATSGIYIILNTKNGWVYIGQAQDFRRRWQQHKSELRGNYHGNRHLQNAWNKYGEKSFKFQRLEFCPVEQLDKREQHYLDIYMPRGICYNIAKDVIAPSRGTALSTEHKQKIAEANRKRVISEETRHRMSEGHRGQHSHNKGKPLSEETRQKLSESHRGKTHDEEARRKMSQTRKGRTHTAETRRKMSENNAMKNPEVRRKIADANRGRTVSEETRRKIGEANKGKSHPVTDETRNMIRERHCLFLYEVISPDNEVFITKNLKAFCREHDLSNQHMFHVVHGKRSHHKGYKCRKIEA